MLDFGGGYLLRRATPADHRPFEKICLETGDAGRDATWREDDPALMGQIFAVPYQVLESEFAFAIEGPTGVCGSLLGALDTTDFNRRLARDWYPHLRARVRDPGPDETRWHGSDWVRRAIHHPDLAVPAVLAPYPSHGHIDLLPEARSRGIGRRAMAFLEERLAAAGSPGLHLSVHPENHRALSFYAKRGMARLPSGGLPAGSVFVVRTLARGSPDEAGD